MIKHILKTSLERNWIITIMYYKDGEITKRNIKVISICKDNVKAFCFLRSQNRVFKFENILSAEYYKVPKIAN